MRDARCDGVDERQVIRARLKKLRWSISATIVNVDDGANLIGPHVILREQFRAQQSGFLAIGHQNNHGALWRLLQCQHARRVQAHGHAHAVVGTSGRHGHGIMMGHQQNGGQICAALFTNKNIPQSNFAKPGNFYGGNLLLRRVPKRGEIILQARHRRNVGRATHGPRFFTQHQARRIQRSNGGKTSEISGI